MRASYLIAACLSLIGSPLTCDRRPPGLPPAPAASLAASLDVLNECGFTLEYVQARDMIRDGRVDVKDLRGAHAAANLATGRISFDRRTLEEWPPRYVALDWVHELMHLSTHLADKDPAFERQRAAAQRKLMAAWELRHRRAWGSIGEEDAPFARAIRDAKWWLP